MTGLRTVLVTGGAGFVGIPTVRTLLAHGYRVVVLDNFQVGKRDRLAPLEAEHRDRLVVCPADLRDAVQVKAVVHEARPWGVVHLAALHFIPYCVAHPSETVAVNVLGLQHVLDALAGQPVERLTFASTADVYTPDVAAHDEEASKTPTNVYGASKLAGEWLLRYARQAGLRAAVRVPRFFNVIGPGETNPHVLPAIIEQLRTSDVIQLGNLDPKRDYIFVGDIAAAVVALLERDGDDDLTVNVGTGRSCSVREVVEVAADLLGRPLRIEVDPARVRATDRPNLQASVQRLDALLPDRPRTSLRDGLRALLRSEGFTLRAG